MRGRGVSLMVVEVFHADLAALEKELLEKSTVAPSFFRNAPVLMDFEHLEEDIDLKWFNDAYDMLYIHSFIPVGVVAPPEHLKQVIAKQQIAVWPSAEAARKASREMSSRQEESALEKQESQGDCAAVAADEQDVTEGVPSREMSDESESAGVIPSVQPTMMIHQPVRSGQKVYARGGDLIIMAQVSTGAEVMADGHIHVYGTLRGRAFAGAQGDESARIFCKDLQADLISVAGTYLINDDLPQNLRNHSVQVYLRGEQLVIEPL